jgi:hypothetical protein
MSQQASLYFRYLVLFVFVGLGACTSTYIGGLSSADKQFEEGEYQSVIYIE